MKKTTLPALIIALFLTACTSSEKPPTYAELQQNRPAGTAAAEPETNPETADPAEEEAAKLREKTAAAVSEILTENREVKFGTTVYGTQTAVECDGGIYIILNKISLLNRKTGLLQGALQ